ncbi:PQQ-binding-like beta-propeller repeat protein [uncultured Methanoregula sp.]|uniref:beta-alanine-activating enzyme beta-propeller domain-containing protein n=1 Tax=uncultured Methanoregula sp. TaxID=1005933 RepID=UPI002AAC37BD|nr:PQQ-binding-like beta-propeller repeat protein [uncultured Methanoregula sp.]
MVNKRYLVYSAVLLLLILFIASPVQAVDLTAVEWSEKAAALNSLGKYQEALDANNKALSIDWDYASAWYGKGVALSNLGKYQEALDVYNQALLINPKLGSAWAGKGTVLARLGRNQEALNAYNQALSINPGSATAWAGKGAVLARLGRNQEALETYNQALLLDPGNEDIYRNKELLLARTDSGHVSVTMSFLAPPSPASPEPAMMFHADPAHTGVFKEGGNVSGNNELWRFKTRDHLISSPVVSYGVVYAGAGDLYAIDAGTGKEMWRFNPEFRCETFSSSPAVSEGVVYTGSNFLYAIDAVTGVEKWHIIVWGASSPTVSNGVVYVGSRDNNLYAIDAVNGTENWRFTTGNSVYTSPAVSGGVVYIGSSDHNLTAIDAVTGKERWRFRTMDAIYSSPAVSDGVVYIGSNDHNLYAIDAGTGMERWRFTTRNWVLSSPAVSNGVVYVGSSDNYLYAIDAATGVEKWQFKTMGPVYSSPALSESVVYVGSNDNNLYAIDRVTGKEKWRFSAGGPVDSSPVVSQEMVFVGGGQNNLYAVGNGQLSPVMPDIVSPEKISGTASTFRPTWLFVIIIILLIAGGVYVFRRRRRIPAGKPVSKIPEKPSLPPRPSAAGSVQKPDLRFSLDRPTLKADEWDHITINMENRGNAAAKEVRFSFTYKFATKGVKPVAVSPGSRTSIEVNIQPRFKGKIPLEVTAMYSDNTGMEYTEMEEFDVDVIEKRVLPPGSPGTFSLPAVPSVPRPAAPEPEKPEPMPVEEPAYTENLPEPEPGEQIPVDLRERYTGSVFLGKDRFARIFRVRKMDGKFAIVKVATPMSEPDAETFMASMRNWAKLSHPNIVRLLDFNTEPVPFFEEEFCDHALAERKKPLECEEAAWIVYNISEGLRFAHHRHVTHLDLQPHNILFKNGIPKISGFGLSRILADSPDAPGMLPARYYAAPEQVENRTKDERTDIWHLGVIFYELVTGLLPFEGDSMAAIGMSITTGNPKSPGEIVPGAQGVNAIIMRCLEQDPAKRYQSTSALQKDLSPYLGDYSP